VSRIRGSGKERPGEIFAALTEPQKVSAVDCLTARVNLIASNPTGYRWELRGIGKSGEIGDLDWSLQFFQTSRNGDGLPRHSTLRKTR